MMKKGLDAAQAPLGQRNHLGPAWRLRVANNTKIPRQETDTWVVACHRFLRAVAKGGRSAALAKGRYPLIAAAMDFDRNPEKSDVARVMVAADMSAEEIQQRTGVPADVIAAWETLFFDVRDTREASGWFRHKVIEPVRRAGNVLLAARLKLAHSVGAIVVPALLDAEGAIPLDVADSLFARRVRLQAKYDAADAMSIGSRRDAASFRKTFLLLDLERQRIELAAKKVALRCQRESEKFMLAKLRSEEALRRDELALASQRERASARAQWRAAKSQKLAAARQARDERHATVLQERAARAAASPLAQLTWPAAPRKSPFANTKTVTRETARPKRQTARSQKTDGYPQPA